MAQSKKWYKLLVVFSEVICIGEEIKTQPFPFEDLKQFTSQDEAKKAAEKWANGIAVRQRYKQRPYVEAFEQPLLAMLSSKGVDISLQKDRLNEMVTKLLGEYENQLFWQKSVMSYDRMDSRIMASSKIMMALLGERAPEYQEMLAQHQEHLTEFKQVVLEELTNFFTHYYNQKAVAAS